MFTRLKQSTSLLHARLEDTIEISNYLSSLEQYVSLLRLFFGFYSPLEAKLACIEGIDIIDFHTRRKVPLLQKDLQSLGLQAHEIDTLNLCTDLPRLMDLPSALGCMYVIEGSTLGGQVISRQLHHLGIYSDKGGSFFNSYGGDVGRMWLSFKQTVETHVSNVEAETTLMAAAEETFVKLLQWVEISVMVDKYEQP